MTVYLVILEDRHTDVQVEVFMRQEAAMKRAREIVEEYDFGDGGSDLPTSSEWLFGASLSHEGDYVHVEKAEVKR